MQSYGELENACANSFHYGGQYWHAYTSGKNAPVLFATEEDYKFAMNVIAQASAAVPDAKIVAFEVMSNHFHFAFNTQEDVIPIFWEYIRKRLSRYFPEMKKIEISYKPIEDLQAMRNAIVYINRNAFVANRLYMPFNYPWGTGRYYFMDKPGGCRQIGDFSIDKKRELFRCRTPLVPQNWEIKDGYVSPASYCCIEFGMAMFRDSQHYFIMQSKNIESYHRVAVDIDDDDDFMTDSDLYSQVISIVNKEYQMAGLRDMAKSQKLDLARRLRRDFRSSNEQIRRVLNLTKYEIDQLYPDSKKPQ